MRYSTVNDMKHYNIIISLEGSKNTTIVANHEPIRNKSVAYEMLEILRRSYQALGYSVVHLEYGRFAIADASNWIVTVSLETVNVDKL